MTTAKIQALSLEQRIFQCFMNVSVLHDLFDSPRTLTSNKITFKLIDRGQTDFDYDSQDTQEASRIYQVEDIFIRLNGYFTSTEGLRVQSWEFVAPKPVQKIEYVKV